MQHTVQGRRIVASEGSPGLVPRILQEDHGVNLRTNADVNLTDVVTVNRCGQRWFMMVIKFKYMGEILNKPNDELFVESG